MKKVVLFLTVIGTVLLMASCLGDTETYYSGSPLSYITSTNSGVVYAKTVDGLFITSPKIQLEGEPGSFAFITYSWKESENTIREDGIYNATVTQISDPLYKGYLLSDEAPGEQEAEPLLESFQQVVYGGPYFDNHWIFAYSYKKEDGSKKGLRLYYNPETMGDNEIAVDIRLVDIGETIDKDQKDVLIAVDFSDIHEHYAAALSPGGQKNLKVVFRYYQKKSDGTLELKELPYTMSIVKEQ